MKIQLEAWNMALDFITIVSQEVLGHRSSGLSVGSTVDFLLNWGPARHHHESRHVAASQNKGTVAPSSSLHPPRSLSSSN